MIELKQVTIRQGDFRIESLDLTIPSMAYAVMMGRTGCGKTTLLETICGLRRLDSGRIEINGHNVTQLDCSQRGIGYVPQDRALFPTMRVDRQIEFGMLVRGVGASPRRERVEQLATLVGIEDLLKRYPGGLSGGEQQRVALARALSFKPHLLCLDEPLSALDSGTRSSMVELLQNVHREEQVTVLHITHNLDEAQSLATVQFSMADGVIENVPNPRNISQART